MFVTGFFLVRVFLVVFLFVRKAEYSLFRGEERRKKGCLVLLHVLFLHTDNTDWDLCFLLSSLAFVFFCIIHYYYYHYHSHKRQRRWFIHTITCCLLDPWESFSSLPRTRKEETNYPLHTSTYREYNVFPWVIDVGLLVISPPPPGEPCVVWRWQCSEVQGAGALYR